MENTYYSSSYVSETQRNTAIIMAIIGILLGLGVSIYLGVSIFSESSINIFGIIFAPFKSGSSSSSNSDVSFVSLIGSLLLLIIVICFMFPVTTIVLGIIVLASRGYKKTVTTLLYVFMVLTLIFFVQSVIK